MRSIVGATEGYFIEFAVDESIISEVQVSRSFVYLAVVMENISFILLSVEVRTFPAPARAALPHSKSWGTFRGKDDRVNHFTMFPILFAIPFIFPPVFLDSWKV